MGKSTRMAERRLNKSQSSADEEEYDLFKEKEVPRNYKCFECDKWFFMECAAFVALIAGLLTSLIAEPLKKRIIWGLESWKWFLMVLVVFCGRLVSGWIIHVAVFVLERNFILRKRVLYFVYGVRRSAKNCLWFGLVLLAWNLMFDKKVDRATKNNKLLDSIEKLLFCLLCAAFLWLFKTLFVKILALNFHVKTYFDRIQESIFHQYVLETISPPPMMEIHQSPALADKKTMENAGHIEIQIDPPDNRNNDRAGHEEKGGSNAINIEQLQKLNQRNVSAWNMKRLIRMIRYSGIGNIANTIDKSVNFHKHDREIASERQAAITAKRIFANVDKRGTEYIEEDDLLKLMREKEVSRVFPQFVGASDTGRITESSLTNWVMNVFVERKLLSQSLNDSKTAVKQLHRLINAVVIMIILVLSLVLLGIASTHAIVIILSHLLLVAFMFGNTCKTIFEAIVFVFITHPFDVGDRCVVDGVEMVVEEMNILTTVFLCNDNAKVYYPNSILSTKPISNYHRSPDMGESVDFFVDVSTTEEKIAALKERIRSYIEKEPHHWHSEYSLFIKEIENTKSMRMGLCLRHTMNYQNICEKSNRRSDLLLKMREFFEELEIEYHLLPQEVPIKFVGSTAR
ncbi:hypothetical protein SUGI_1114220 [Cryptomeria japonica]|nr:hypothetical protein SUGI_1114220 [Cryptomeria japonica]